MTTEIKNGAIQVSSIIENQLQSHRYIGYTKSQAIKKFKSRYGNITTVHPEKKIGTIKHWK